MSEDYALVRYKNIAPGFDPAESSNLIVDAVKDMVLDANSIGHHWQWLNSQVGDHDHLYRSIEPVSGSVHQILRIRSEEGTVKFIYFSTDATVADFSDYDSITATSQLREDFDLRGTSEFYDFDDLEYYLSPISLDQSKVHRIWLAEYRESNSNSCATENACALTILVEEITDEGTNNARFVLGAHVGSVITPVNANERLARLISTTNDSTDPPYLYALSTDAALVGVPNNPNRMMLFNQLVAESDEPNWLGQNIAIEGSWVQVFNSRKSFAAIGHGSHLPDSFMLSLNGRQKLLPFTSYAKESRNIKFEKFSCRGISAAAIDEKGTLYTWGVRTDLAGKTITLSTDIFDVIHTYPTPVSNPNQYSGSWKDAATAEQSLFAIDADDRLWARGNENDYGELGLGNLLPSAELKLVATPMNHPGKWKKVVASNLFCLGLDADDKLWSWGYNFVGQLGIGEEGPGTDKSVPTLVSDPVDWGGAKWIQVSAGDSYSLAIDDQGRAWAWGDNFYSQLGIGEGGPETNKNVPTLVSDPVDWGGAKWIQVSAGRLHSLAIDDQGRAWAWGFSDSGQFGIGESEALTKSVPTLVIDPEGWNGAKWVQVSAGRLHSLAIDDQGRAWAWGNNTFGQLGIGESGMGTEKNVPTLVSNDNDYWIQIEASIQENARFGLALDDNKSIWAWGYNSVGQLGIKQSGPDVLGPSRSVFSDPPDKNVPTKLNYYIANSISTELGRTRYVRQLGTEPLEHGAIFVSSTPSSQQAWKALGNGSNQIILWSTTAVEVA